MHLNNVKGYAPEGYTLSASHMDEGQCVHVFSAEGKPELRCEGSWATPDEERAALEHFLSRVSPGVALAVTDEPGGHVVTYPADSPPPKLEALRAALDEGDASPVSPDYSLDKVLDKVYAAGDTVPPAKQAKRAGLTRPDR